MKKAYSFLLWITIFAVLLSTFTACGYFYFTPEQAAEKTSIGLSQKPYFKGDGCRFYYETVGERYDQPGDYADWICEVIPVVQNEQGLWHTVTRNPYGGPVYPYGVGQSVGGLSYIESNGTYHNFFIPDFQRENMSTGEGAMVLPEELPADYDSVTIDGNEYPLMAHGYFITDFEVEEFEIDGKRFLVDNDLSVSLIREWRDAYESREEGTRS